MAEPLPLVLVPGLLCDAALWAPVLERLDAGAGPQRAHRVADVTRADSMSALAAAVLRDAPWRFALAGLSMGGYVALEMMRQAPERIAGLALLDTTARPDTDEQRRRRKGLIDLSRRGQFKGVTPKLLPMLIHPDRQDDRPLVDTVTQMAERIGQAAFTRQQTAIMTRIDSRPFLPAIRCPAAVVVGRQDALTPVDLAEEMAGLLPDARLTVVEDSGHLPPLERPDAAAVALRAWLDRIG